MQLEKVVTTDLNKLLGTTFRQYSGSKSSAAKKVPPIRGIQNNLHYLIICSLCVRLTSLNVRGKHLHVTHSFDTLYPFDSFAPLDNDANGGWPGYTL